MNTSLSENRSPRNPFAAAYAPCPGCREETLTITGYPEGCELAGAVIKKCVNADCGWELGLDPEGRPFDEESEILRSDLQLLHSGIDP